MRFVATVSDRPGGIAELTRLIADNGVSIKDIYHERAWLQSRIDQVMVKVVVETTGRDHTKQLRRSLQEKVMYLSPITATACLHRLLLT